MNQRLRQFVITSVVLLCAAPALAQTAGMLSFQGLIKDADGNLVNGTVDLEFRIYDAQTDGTVVAGPFVASSVELDRGVVATEFGPVAAEAFDGTARWLEIRANGAQTSPRINLLGAPATPLPGGGNAAVYVTPEGNVGIGSGDPSAKLEVLNHDDNVQSTRRLLRIGDVNEQETSGSFLEVTGGTGRDITLASTWSNLHLGASNTGQVATRTLTIHESGRVGIAAENPIAPLEIHSYADYQPWSRRLLRIGDLSADGTTGSVLEVMGGEGRQITFTNTWAALHFGASASGQEEVRHLTICESGNIGIGIQQPSAKLDVDGQVRMKVAQITGGSDLAEPFVVNNSSKDAHTIESGMVVSIDPTNPGKLILATEAYDRKVAGVISGAGGVQPGMIMKQEGHPTADGEHLIAMAGKVYVWADADANGTIQPGDRLTTSATPGHAMKVTNKEEGIGAVIGKAMTGLSQGKGLVLLLVQPQ